MEHVNLKSMEHTIGLKAKIPKVLKNMKAERMKETDASISKVFI